MTDTSPSLPQGDELVERLGGILTDVASTLTHARQTMHAVAELRPKIGPIATQAQTSGWRIAEALEQVATASTILAFLTTDKASQAQRIAELEEGWAFIWKWVERGIFCSHTPPKTALEVLAYHPSAPWNEGRWDVDHKPYAREFYRAFPKAALSKDTTNG